MKSFCKISLFVNGNVVCHELCGGLLKIIITLVNPKTMFAKVLSEKKISD